MTNALDGNSQTEPQEIDIEVPLDMRPDLSALGINETDKGICQDTYENRSILRKNSMWWETVFDKYGKPTSLIVARSKEAIAERSLIGVTGKRALLSDPKKNNSDFLTGEALLVDADACGIAPAWVVAATRKWVAEQRDGPLTPRRSPLPLPQRCRIVKSDGMRCLLWESGLPKAEGLCSIHAIPLKNAAGETISRARNKILQAATYAVDVLEELMDDAQSEPVRLKAASEILDRAGVRGGIEVDLSGDVNIRSSSDIIAERLRKLSHPLLELPAAEDAVVVSSSTAADSAPDPSATEDFTIEDTDNAE